MQQLWPKHAAGPCGSVHTCANSLCASIRHQAHAHTCKACVDTHVVVIYICGGDSLCAHIDLAANTLDPTSTYIECPRKTLTSLICDEKSHNHLLSTAPGRTVRCVAAMAAYTLDSRTFMQGQQLLSAQRQHKPNFGLTTIAQAGRSIRDPNAPPKESRIGKQVVPIPGGVEVKVDGQHVSVKVCCQHEQYIAE